MAKKSDAVPKKPIPSVGDSLARLSQKLDKSRTAKRGDIVLHLSGEGGGSYCLACGPGQTTLSQAAVGRLDQEPLIQVWGDAAVIRSILDGERDALKQFVAGGLRIRGDLRYFSDLALELGIISRPL